MSLLRLRPVVDSDAVGIYRYWDVETLRFSGIPRVRLNWEEHLSWFCLTRENRDWFIGEASSAARGWFPVGSVRLDRATQQGAYWVSIVVDPLERGEGYGLAMLEAVVNHRPARHPTTEPRVLNARVHAFNAPSLRIFQKAGFKDTEPDVKATWRIYRMEVGP